MNEKVGMQGNSKPSRIIGDLVFYDSLAALEDPTSPEFVEVVNQRRAAWANTLKPFTKQVQRWERLFRKIYSAAIPAGPAYAHEVLGKDICLQHTSGHLMNVWIHGKKLVGLTGFARNEPNGMYCTIRDIGEGAETLELSVWTKDHERLWSTNPVGPDAVFYGDTILYQTVENQLRYPGVKQADLQTGVSKLLYEEPDKRFQIELVQPPYQPYVFLRRANAMDQQLALLDPANPTLQWFPKQFAGSVFPITKDIYGSDTSIVLNKQTYPLLPNEFLVDAICFNEGILFSTVHQAKMSLYIMDKTMKIRRIFAKDFPCEIKLRKHALQPTIEIGYPYKGSEIYLFQNTLKRDKVFHTPVQLTFHHGTSVSKDGTKVPYTLVYEKGTKPTKLFVEGYGSYGISSRRSYPINRLPWIKRGYAYATVFARGGREDGDRWWDGGRTALRKQNTFDDVAATIETLQTKFGFRTQRTVFYGRSAGGLLAANIAQQFPNLVKVVYAEVPYLDVIRTTSNPKLPLTQMEYDEFGDPVRRPEELRALQLFSPVDTVPQASKYSPTIVVKTALHDSQVLPYETLKWAKRLNEKGWQVHVGIDGGGHFLQEKALYKALAEDAAIIDHVIQSSRGTTRRKHSSSKHFTRHRTSSRAE